MVTVTRPASFAPYAQPGERTAPGVLDVWPGLAREVAWVGLAHLPTPVERAVGLSGYVDASRVWAKRDDLISPLYGGNKVRRYEFVLGDALARGASHIVTAGGLASTQVTATACFTRALGLECTAVMFDQPVTRFAQTAILADVSEGARLVYGGGYVRTAVKTALARWQTAGSYTILPGAANALANLGYLDAMLELAAQVERGECPRPEVIVLPTGSSGTLAALALGCAWLGWETEVIGVRITTSLVCNRATVGFVIDQTARWLHARDARFSRDLATRAKWSLYGGALGPGYGAWTREAEEGAQWIERWTGAPGELTYSGKALAGLRALQNDARYRGKTFLLWNTLSTPRPRIADDARESVPEGLQWVLARRPRN